MSQHANRNISRRKFLEGVVAFSGALLLPAGFARSAGTFAASAEATRAMAESPLIYLTPLRSDGSESQCHGEVWFAESGGDLLVVTASERWRAQAIGRGLDRARIWVGDFGPWKDANDRFRAAPTFVASAELVSNTDAKSIELALTAFGAKYTKEWSKWGPRFSKGLADGSCVLIRYRAVGA